MSFNKKTLKNFSLVEGGNKKEDIDHIFHFRNKRKNEQKDMLINKYLPLIRFIAKKMILRLPANIEIDDLISCGMIGLVDAIEKYNPDRENKFQTYAEFRIRGAMLDELRSQDWVPRSIRNKAKVLNKTISELELKLRREPKDREIADHLGLNLNDFYKFLDKARPASLFSMNEGVSFAQLDRKALIHLIGDSRLETPFSKLNVKDIRDLLIKTIEALPEKQRVVLSLYYYEELNLKEIGRVLRVTESRVSQLHTQAVINLRNQLRRSLYEMESFQAS